MRFKILNINCHKPNQIIQFQSIMSKNINAQFKNYKNLAYQIQIQKRMDNEVAQLKKKIKQLQKQLCERTRNYLYHYKKSPIKQGVNTKQQQTQTQVADERQYRLQLQIGQMNSNEKFQKVQLNLKRNSNSIQNSQLKIIKSQSTQPLNSQKIKKKVLQIQINNPNFSTFDLQLKSKNQNHISQIQNLSSQIRQMKEQLERTNTPRDKKGIKIDFFSTSKFQTPNSDKQAEGMTQSTFKHNKQFEIISQESQLKFQQTSHKFIEDDCLKKQFRILKKQIKKLKAHLQYQIKASTQTKQALLISQEQNYKFRLQIQQLRKQITLLSGSKVELWTQRSEPCLKVQENLQNQVNQFINPNFSSEFSQSTKQQLQKVKSQTQKYQQYISILQGVKKDYLKKCIQAKQQIYELKQKNQKLIFEIKQLKSIVLQTNSQLSIERNEISKKSQQIKTGYHNGKSILQNHWSQLFKQKIHQISNCLPLIQNEELFLFRPQTIEDLISMLQRILQFCKKIEIWQKQKIQAIQKQRSNLLRIISTVLMKHPTTKDTIAEQISEIQELKYLVNFLNKESRNTFSGFNYRKESGGILDDQLKSNTHQKVVQTN